MVYQALYRKWRSKTFDEIIGQDHITEIIKKQSADNKVSHAYLFCGSRGTGKTSTAKILAKAVNCDNPVNGNPCNECFPCRSIDNSSATDVLEIDAASNNRVDDVRELIDEVVYPPSVLKKRVYIIDEVHMLSNSAFNALLKTLEEPPEYVLFILATTELNQLPLTIISRCMRFEFKRIIPEMLVSLLENIANKEAITIENDALKLIAKLADGSARDALSLLDACAAGVVSGKSLTVEDVRTQLGITNSDIIINMFDSIANKNLPDALEHLNEVHKSSKDLNVFVTDLIIFVKDLLVAKSCRIDSNECVKLLKDNFVFSSSATAKLAGIVESFTVEMLFYFSGVLEDTVNLLSRYSVNKKSVFELTIIRLFDASLSIKPEALLARISNIERTLSNKSFQIPTITTDEASLKSTAKVLVTETTSKKTEVKSTKNQTPNDCTPVPITFFPEVLEELTTLPDLQPIVGGTKIYQTVDSFLVSGNSFAIEMLSKDQNKDILHKALQRVSGMKYNLLFEVKSIEESSQESFLDEINS